MENLLKLGFIGCDTSHCTAFTRLLHSDKDAAFGVRCQVVAAYPGSSPKVDPDGSRVRRFTAELRDLGVPLVDTPEAAAEGTDAIMILSADGSLHLEEFKRTLRPGRPVFIDKPLAWDSADVNDILSLAADEGVAVGSASSLRFSRALDQAMQASGGASAVTGAEVYCPGTLLGDQGLFYYAIHGVEMLYRIMGPGCQSVTAWSDEKGDYVVGNWSENRRGWLRANRTGNKQFGALIHTTEQTVPAINITSGSEAIYIPMLEKVIPFLSGTAFPVATTEMAEVIRFIEASHSGQRSGAMCQL